MESTNRLTWNEMGALGKITDIDNTSGNKFQPDLPLQDIPIISVPHLIYIIVIYNYIYYYNNHIYIPSDML